MGKRADVLRLVHRTLETYAPLASYLGHTVEATTIPAGGKIIGDDVRIESLPLPSLVLGFGEGDSAAPAREATDWTVEAVIYAHNVFQAADVLDHLEDLSRAWSRNPALAQPGGFNLNRFRIGAHRALDAVGPAGRLIALAVTIHVTWIQTP